MIKIDFSIAIAIYLTLNLMLVIGFWLFYTCNREKQFGQEFKFLHQCTYCTYVFLDYSDSKIKICPKCRSYIIFEETESEKDA